MAVLSVNSAIPGVVRLIWTDLNTADNGGPRHTVLDQNGLAGCVQVTGTFGSGTFVLQGSNDGTNWVTLKDRGGSNISLTAAGMAEFVTASAYIRPFTSGGTADNLTVTVVLRG